MVGAAEYLLYTIWRRGGGREGEGGGVKVPRIRPKMSDPREVSSVGLFSDSSLSQVLLIRRSLETCPDVAHALSGDWWVRRFPILRSLPFVTKEGRFRSEGGYP